MEDLPQKIRHTTNVTENLSVSVGQTFATVPMWKIRHTTVIGWGRGGLGRGGWGVPNSPQPPRPNSPNPLDPTFPTSTLLTPTLPTQPPPPDPNLSSLCGESATSALLQTFVRRLRSNSGSHSYVSPVVWRILWQLVRMTYVTITRREVWGAKPPRHWYCSTNFSPPS